MSKSKNTNNVTAKMYDSLVRPVITEKSMLSSENGKVTFLVPLSANKDEVKAAVEAGGAAAGRCRPPRCAHTAAVYRRALAAFGF